MQNENGKFANCAPKCKMTLCHIESTSNLNPPFAHYEYGTPAPRHRPTHAPHSSHDPHDDGTDTNGRSSDGRPAPNRRNILVEIFCSGHATISCRCRYRCCTGGHPIPRPRNTGPSSHHSHTMEATGAGAGVGCHCSRRFLEAAISARRAIRQGQK